jgi:hypothetical protein
MKKGQESIASQPFDFIDRCLVGARRFELPTPCTPSEIASISGDSRKHQAPIFHHKNQRLKNFIVP